ncbi:MAG: alpha-galactosidase [Bacilli bacterium]
MDQFLDWKITMISKIDNYFILENEKISYIINILENKQIGQVYFGKKIHIKSKLNLKQERLRRSIVCNEVNNFFSYDFIKSELGTLGGSDFGVSSIDLEYPDDTNRTEFEYFDYQVVTNNQQTTDFPQVEKVGSETLVVTLKSKNYELYIDLNYRIHDEACITRSTRLYSNDSASFKLKKLYSYNLDMNNEDYKLVTLPGQWLRETHFNQEPINPGIKKIESQRGTSSADINPFYAITTSNEIHTGQCYAVNLLYSGNFEQNIQLNSFDKLRLNGGLSTVGFDVDVNSGFDFTTPEAIITFSANGLDELGRINSKFIRENIQKKQGKQKIPTLINSWEGMYFEINERKILDLAKNAHDLGIEMLVIDDGWFKKRNDDTSSLGDWKVETEKFPNGLGYISNQIKSKYNLKFGLWFEPEMISEESELFKKHSEYIISTKRLSPIVGRNQYILDLTNAEVEQFILDTICNAVESYELDYIKWDMNRYRTDYSVNNSGELPYDVLYYQALYRILNHITVRYPQLILETCASGGARFDLGMIKYSDLIWASDDTDPCQRITIQQGKSFAYPHQVFSNHISLSPHHQTFRDSTIYHSHNVAYFGNLGVELDVNTVSDKQWQEIKETIEFYKKNRDFIKNSELYRIELPQEYGIYSPFALYDHTVGKSVVLVAMNNLKPNYVSKYIKLDYLDANEEYIVNGKDVYSGSQLKNMGILIDKYYTGNNCDDISHIKLGKFDTLGLSDSSSCLIEIQKI